MITTRMTPRTQPPSFSQKAGGIFWIFSRAVVAAARKRSDETHFHVRGVTLAEEGVQPKQNRTAVGF